MGGMGGQIRVQREGALGWLVFDHPERHNALSSAMWEALPDAARALDADDAVRVVLLRGAGERAFVSGADISEFPERRSGAGARAYEELTARAWHALGAIQKPVVAMIHGFCIGGGLATALAADLRFAADDAAFAIPAARLGLGYPVSGAEALRALVGPAAALELIFTAARVDASRAQALGLVNAVFPKAELEAQVRALAARIAENAPLTLRSAKRVMRELAHEPAARDRAALAASIQRCFDSADYREGVRAFLEKRAPRFSGR